MEEHLAPKKQSRLMWILLLLMALELSALISLFLRNDHQQLTLIIAQLTGTLKVPAHDHQLKRFNGEL